MNVKIRNGLLVIAPEDLKEFSEAMVPEIVKQLRQSEGQNQSSEPAKITEEDVQRIAAAVVSYFDETTIRAIAEKNWGWKIEKQ